MWVKILLLFFVFSFIFKPDYSFDQDLGRHLKLGGIIWQTKSVPGTNLFSYTNPDFPFINTHWLFEVWVYLTSQAIGLPALLVIKIVVFLISVWLIFKIIPKSSKALLLPIGFIFLHVLRERLELRPEIFSFLFTAGTYYILEKYLIKPTKLIYLLPLIQLLWINTHIYFFVGLILQAIFLIYLAYHHLRLHPKGVKLKMLSNIFVLSVILSLINPQGLAGFLYPLNVTKNYGYTIVENQTMFLLESINFQDPNFIWVKLSLGIILLSLLLVIARTLSERSESKGTKQSSMTMEDSSLIVQNDKGKLVKNILLAGFGATLAVMNVRSFPYLVFISLPTVLQNFGNFRPKWLAQTLATIAGIFLILESFSNLKVNQFPSLQFEEHGKQALDFAIINNLPGPIYNNFDIGSYIIYRSYPKYKVFVDGRPEAYPKEFFSEVYIPTQADYAKFQLLEKQYNFKTIIFSVTDQTPWGRNFLNSVAKDNSWQAVYLDNFMIVLTKNNVQ